MTDWGSHGAGDPAETETPFVFFGAGIRKTEFTQPDVRLWQIDTAPLISALLGLRIPANRCENMGFMLISDKLLFQVCYIK